MSEPLTGLSSMATRHALADLCRAHEAAGGGSVRFESIGGVDAARRVRAGEAIDLVVLAADAIDALASAGDLVADSRTAIIESSVAVAVPLAAPRPDVASEEALRRALLAARRIGYSTGPSGTALLQLFERWGITERLQGRLVQAPPGTPVAALLAGGQADLGFQQQSELQGEAGIVVLGAMPPGLEIVTTFVGAVGARSTRADEARAVLEFLRSPSNDEIKRRHGMAPACQTGLLSPTPIAST
jgi:molybdate transport system substrate-binding protein